MLVYNSRLIGTPVLSVQAGGPIGYVSSPIIDPDTLKILAFRLEGPLISRNDANLLDVKSIREYSNFGIVIDDIEELIGPEDVIKIAEVLKLNFNLIGLKAETKKGSKLGKISDFTVTSEDFLIQQLVIRRPAIKSLLDPELVVSRKEVAEVTDYKVILKDEEKTIKEKATKEDFIPNFVNPFRNKEHGFTPAETENTKN